MHSLSAPRSDAADPANGAALWAKTEQILAAIDSKQADALFWRGR